MRKLSTTRPAPTPMPIFCHLRFGAGESTGEAGPCCVAASTEVFAFIGVGAVFGSVGIGAAYGEIGLSFDGCEDDSICFGVCVGGCLDVVVVVGGVVAFGCVTLLSVREPV